MEIDDPEAGPSGQELRAPAEAARANANARTQIIRRHRVPSDEDISRVLPRRNRRDHEPGRDLGRQVLQAVDRKVDVALEEGVLDSLREGPLPVEGGAEVLSIPFVPMGPDHDRLRPEVRADCTKSAHDFIRLRERERAAARADAKHRGHPGPPCRPTTIC